mgnify:CR=1 FL=1
MPSNIIIHLNREREGLSAEENLKRQDEMRIKNKASLIKFYKDFTSMLLEFEIYDFVKTIHTSKQYLTKAIIGKKTLQRIPKHGGSK